MKIGDLVQHKITKEIGVITYKRKSTIKVIFKGIKMKKSWNEMSKADLLEWNLLNKKLEETLFDDDVFEIGLR